MTNVTGGPQNYGFMGNFLYDLPVARLNLPFQPYAGAGIGSSRFALNSVTGTEPFYFPVSGSHGLVDLAPSVRTSGSARAFAYQIIAGASTPVRGTPGLEATLEYRYFSTVNANVPDETYSLANLPANVNSSIPNFTKVQSHDSSLLVGLRYSFTLPRP